MIDRIDVLNKVKELFLIPAVNMIDSKSVAEYYNTPIESIKTVYKRNKEEIDNDGVKRVSSKDFCKVHLEPSKVEYTRCKGRRGVTTYVIDGYKFEIHNGESVFFSPRAVLRIGMLLRDSEVAKEVRTQLLNTFLYRTNTPQIGSRIA